MDALLVLSFGGPEGPDDVVPFLENVTRGRGIPRERLVEVGAHYSHFGGVSPINSQNRALVAAVESALADRGDFTPVLWGNRNWTPYLTEALARAQAMGVDDLYVFVTSAFSSYSGCRQYRENLHDGMATVQSEFPSWRPRLHLLPRFWNHPGFIEPFVAGVRDALAGLPTGSRLVFTTHSIPLADAERCDYLAQHRDAAAVIAEQVGVGEWDLVFQSRSGAPHVPWLEPDISDHLAEIKGGGSPGVVVVPIGFVSDHMEVVWDLDTVAAQTASDLGLPFVRVPTPGTDPSFVAMVADLLAEARTGRLGRRQGSLGPRATPCAANCCPNPRGPRPALCGALDW